MVCIYCAVGLNFCSYRLELAQYTEFDTSTLDPLYYVDNNFCTAFFLQILEYLQEHRDVYSTEIALIEQAQPGEYLRRYVEDVPVAQKYGWYDGAVNTVGIVQTETPYLIAVFTDNLYDAENIIGKTNLIFYDYTVHLMEQQKLALAAAETEADAKAVLQAQRLSKQPFQPQRQIQQLRHNWQRRSASLQSRFLICSCRRLHGKLPVFILRPPISLRPFVDFFCSFYGSIKKRTYAKIYYPQTKQRTAELCPGSALLFIFDRRNPN